MSIQNSISTSTSGLHFFPGGLNAITDTSIMVLNDGDVWVGITIQGLTESEARKMVRCAKKAGFEAGPKKWWSRSENKPLKRKKDADYFSQGFELCQGTTRVDYRIFVDLN
ncbi:MAG TPA: hypothetical protein EYN66_24725 [Myxococcales bacterium]|nr:hypothetical protein [Myxococcales bacterium]